MVYTKLDPLAPLKPETRLGDVLRDFQAPSVTAHMPSLVALPKNGIVGEFLEI